MPKKLIITAACFAALAHLAGAGNDELARAIKGIVSADSYRFTVQAGMVKAVVEASFHKDHPLSCKADGIEFFRKGAVLVYKQGDTWQRTQTGTLSDPLRILAASAKIRAVRLPHEELAILTKSLRNVQKGEANIVSGRLDEKTAKLLAPVEDRDLARGGTARLWLDKEGRLAKYEIAIRVQGTRGNAEVNGTVTKTVTLDAVGKTMVDVPVGARKALE